MRGRALRFLEEAGDAAALLYSNREAAAHYRHARAICPAGRPRRRRADRREARRRLAAARPRGRGDRRLVGLPRVAPRPGGPRARGRPPPQDRRRPLAQGRAQGGDRALPEGHQPAEGRAAAARARAPLRGGRLAVPPHRRQHARHLRVGEGAAAGRAARTRRARPAAPTGSSAASSAASATPRRRARTWSARSSSRAAPTTARRSSRCPRSGASSRSPRPTWRARARPTRRRSRWPSRSGCCPPRWSCTPGSPSSPSTAPTGSGGALDRGERRRSPSARASSASSASPMRCAALLRWREGRIGEATVLFHRAHELAEQVGWSEIAFQALFGLAIALRDQGDLDGATAALDQAIEVCERAGLIAQSIQATGARAVILALAHRPQAASEAAAMAPQLAERLHYPIGRAAALEARGVAPEDPDEGAALLAEAEEAWRALDRPLEATRAPSPGRPAAAGRGRRARPGCWPGGRGERGARACRTWRRRHARPRPRRERRHSGARRLLRPVRAGDHDHRRVARQLLAGRVDRLALADLEARDRPPRARGRARTGRRTRRAAAPGRRCWRPCRAGSRAPRPARRPARRGPEPWCR